jgi:hypothetical protein
VGDRQLQLLEPPLPQVQELRLREPVLQRLAPKPSRRRHR